MKSRCWSALTCHFVSASNPDGPNVECPFVLGNHTILIPHDRLVKSGPVEGGMEPSEREQPLEVTQFPWGNGGPGGRG